MKQHHTPKSKLYVYRFHEDEYADEYDYDHADYDHADDDYHENERNNDIDDKYASRQINADQAYVKMLTACSDGNPFGKLERPKIKKH